MIRKIQLQKLRTDDIIIQRCMGMKIKDLKYKLLITVILLVYLIFTSAFSLPCAIKHFSGLECPGCGMTRAWRAVFKGDFAQAFLFHKMFWSVPLLYICFLFDGRLFSDKKKNILFYSLVAIGFGFNWLF